MVTLVRLFPSRVQSALALMNAALAAALFVVVDLTLVRTIYLEMTLFHATSPSLGLPVWVYYAGVLCLSPAVFRGIYRGCRMQLRAGADVIGEG
jgi:TRAP-type C4-dicarboxylate transport system permease small subunit